MNAFILLSDTITSQGRLDIFNPSMACHRPNQEDCLPYTNRKTIL
jgi:hypothetical protein